MLKLERNRGLQVIQLPFTIVNEGAVGVFNVMDVEKKVFNELIGLWVVRLQELVELEGEKVVQFANWRLEGDFKGLGEEEVICLWTFEIADLYFDFAPIFPILQLQDRPGTLNHFIASFK